MNKIENDKKIILLNTAGDGLQSTNTRREEKMKKRVEKIKEIFDNDELSNEEKWEEIEKKITKFFLLLEKRSIRAKMATLSFRERNEELRERNLELIEKNIDLKKSNQGIKEKLAIQIPEECNRSEAGEAFGNLGILIKEMNETYTSSLFTSTALLSRKFIINIVYALSENTGINIIDSLTNVEVNPKESEIYIKDENSFTFNNAVKWLYYHRFLTRKDYDLLEKLRGAANDFNHSMSIPKDIEDAKKLYLTIKGLVESNFDTHNLYSNDNETENNSNESDDDKDYLDNLDEDY